MAEILLFARNYFVRGRVSTYYLLVFMHYYIAIGFCCLHIKKRQFYLYPMSFG